MAAPQLLELLERRLEALTRARPESGDALAFQATLIRTALTAARPPEAPPFPLPRQQVETHVREGVPLLHHQPVHVDVPFAADLFSRLAEVVGSREDLEVGERLAALESAALGGLLDPERVFGEAFVQHEAHLAELAAASAVDPDLLATLAGQSVAPLLRTYAERLGPLMDAASAIWTHGYCPICGGWPILGELRGIELAQWLRCSACGSAWRSARLFCAYCGNEDFRTLTTLTVEGEQRFRIAVCERCNGYLKVCNAFDPPPAELLALEDAASVHLDVAAIERGYQRPPGSGFVIELALPEAEWVEELA